MKIIFKVPLTGLDEYLREFQYEILGTVPRVGDHITVGFLNQNDALLFEKIKLIDMGYDLPEEKENFNLCDYFHELPGIVTNVNWEISDTKSYTRIFVTIDIDKNLLKELFLL